ncbi:MAG: hypothetical protein HQL97_01190 [Magnetococcales bacterium]|nr:hypothetical protein [Magnetococcales bacterium]
MGGIEQIPLTSGDRQRIAEVFNSFRIQFGLELVEKGWDRDSVFDGIDPTKCEFASDLPGVLAILRAGGAVLGIDRDAITLRDGCGWHFRKTKGGGLSLAAEHADLIRGELCG